MLGGWWKPSFQFRNRRRIDSPERPKRCQKTCIVWPEGSQFSAKGVSAWVEFFKLQTWFAEHSTSVPSQEQFRLDSLTIPRHQNLNQIPKANKGIICPLDSGSNSVQLHIIIALHRMLKLAFISWPPHNCELERSCRRWCPTWTTSCSCWTQRFGQPVVWKTESPYFSGWYRETASHDVNS